MRRYRAKERLSFAYDIVGKLTSDGWLIDRAESIGNGVIQFEATHYPTSKAAWYLEHSGWQGCPYETLTPEQEARLYVVRAYFIRAGWQAAFRATRLAVIRLRAMWR
jgi:hypothetical protein